MIELDQSVISAGLLDYSYKMYKEDLPDTKAMARMNFEKRKQYLNRVVVVMKENEQTMERIRTEANLKKFIDAPSFIEGKRVRKVYHKPSIKRHRCSYCYRLYRLEVKKELDNMLIKLKEVPVEKAEEVLLKRITL